MLPKRSELEATFGPISEMQWANENQHMVFLPVPQELQSFLLYSGRPVTKVYCNRLMAEPLSRAFQNILDQGLKQEVKEWGGCFMIRKTRGADSWSVHCWGLAIDINPSTNQLGTHGDISSQLIACFTAEGFVWGGTFSRMDPMHFEYCTED